MRYALLAMAMAWPAFAQKSWLEIQPFGGARFGGRILAGDPNPAPAIQLRNGGLGGVSFGCRATNMAGAEVVWATERTTGARPDGTMPVSLNEFTGNLLFLPSSFGEKTEAYPMIGAGASRVSAGGQSSVKFGGGAGGGVKYFVSRRFGIRIQARWAATEVYHSADEHGAGGKSHDMGQAEVTVGAIWRFHERESRPKKKGANQ
jgi:hypothetical protein